MAINPLDVSIEVRHYEIMAIQSFKRSDTENLFKGESVKKFVNIQSIAMRKLAMLNRAATLNDLRVPPGNHLEALSGNRQGQHSIRVNNQWRVCFVWSEQGPTQVEIVDYH